MIAALDVHYDDARSLGVGAAVLFQEWTDATPAGEHIATVANIAPYVPGEFFRRELPCLLAIIEKFQSPADILVIDGYVRLGDKAGLGQHLFDHFRGAIPVIGVAKTRFPAAPAAQVLRGKSTKPLYVTAVGMDSERAARQIQAMHGESRIPTLLKRVDRIGRLMPNPQ